MENHNLRVCRHCLMGIEAHEGKQFTKLIYTDGEFADDPEETKCEWCEEYGFDELYELI